ncbi:hypothetical protein WA026_015857 [Henosepilachna vigintioctopunctata]|uniref:Uncharacterized protein n=1 Tax=Henosepilachna vigintioctopunctata TaxID=420089 RepID=A0AAW1V0S9_9CUCU
MPGEAERADPGGLSRVGVDASGGLKSRPEPSRSQPAESRLQALEIGNVYLKKLSEESNDKNEILKQNKKLLEKMSFNQTKIINGPNPNKNSKVVQKVGNIDISSETYMNQGMPSALQPLHNATRNSTHGNKVQLQIQIENKVSSLSTTDNE